MAYYAVYVFCDECVDVHPMGISVSLDDGPAGRASVGDFYAGKDPPPEVATLSNNLTRCPNTLRTFTQKDYDQVFLVPIEE
jgi:hypothetical protein